MPKKLAFSIIMCLVLSGCIRTNIKASTYQQVPNPIVTMLLDNDKKIIIELYPDIAPNTVNNFISLIEDGYYDGLTFHRIIEGFIIQTGDPLMNNYGTPGYTIKGEFKDNGIKNKLKHTKGVVSMARSKDYDSAGSQFFITLADINTFNGSYAGFGKVIEGMEVIELIGNTKDNHIYNKLPAIESVTVDTKMIKYPEPEVIPISN